MSGSWSRAWRGRGALVAIALTLAVAGCAANEGQPGQGQPGAVTAKPAPAAFPYGPPLSPRYYRTLVVGNTLFRPLQDGATTVIFVAPDQSLKLRIQAPNGQVSTDTGRETLEPGKVCWQWQRAGTNCFHYYWSGRLLTFVDMDNRMLPAQFLVQKGNAEGL